MSELIKLRQDHADLARMFRQLERIIEEPRAPSQLELFEFRRILMQTLIGHLKLEDWALYPRLIDSGDAEISSAGGISRKRWAGSRRHSSLIATNGMRTRSRPTGGTIAARPAVSSMR